MKDKFSKGVITTYALVFGAIFLILLGGLFGFVLLQLRQSARKDAWNESLHIAEAGINYWRWCLNNNIESQCETEKEYLDAQGNPIGRFSLNIDSQINCGETISKTIISTGWTYKFPQIRRQVKVIYGRASVGQYAYLINDNVWAGSDREIRGLYHSNGGIRMDGENQSVVSSAQEEWICTDSFGCDPCPTDAGCHTEGTDCVCPGVFTTTGNANSDLFDFPVTSFDFDGITIDLAQIKSLTQSHPQEYYWPPVTNINPSGKGYHIKFKNDGTFEVWIITDLQATWAYSLEEGWHYDYFVINSEYLYGTYSIDPNCSAIFVEDDLWVEGEIKGKVTIVSADLINPDQDTDVVLEGNINYTALDGSDGLAVVGERNVLIPPDSPDHLELRGIFIAQKGHFGRNHYPWNIKSKLEIYGSIVSNGRVGTQWSSGSMIVSGYLQRENYFDSHLVYFPPPFVPYVESDFSILNWEEVE
ncbi:hypothetical protein J7K24_03440 [bacterium]|nr:hypothetical protein [bacterium]